VWRYVAEHLQRCLKVGNRVVVVLRPQRPLWLRLLAPNPSTTEGLAVLTCAAAAAAAAMVYLRHSKRGGA
jgi:hypothetical protein